MTIIIRLSFECLRWTGHIVLKHFPEILAFNTHNGSIRRTHYPPRAMRKLGLKEVTSVVQVTRFSGRPSGIQTLISLFPTSINLPTEHTARVPATPEKTQKARSSKGHGWPGSDWAARAARAHALTEDPEEPGERIGPTPSPALTCGRSSAIDSGGDQRLSSLLELEFRVPAGLQEPGGPSFPSPPPHWGPGEPPGEP